jgi:hypothetical protein
VSSLQVKSLFFAQEFLNRQAREEREENILENLCVLSGLCGENPSEPQP